MPERLNRQESRSTNKLASFSWFLKVIVREVVHRDVRNAAMSNWRQIAASERLSLPTWEDADKGIAFSR